MSNLHEIQQKLRLKIKCPNAYPEGASKKCPFEDNFLLCPVERINKLSKTEEYFFNKLLKNK